MWDHRPGERFAPCYSTSKSWERIIERRLRDVGLHRSFSIERITCVLVGYVLMWNYFDKTNIPTSSM